MLAALGGKHYFESGTKANSLNIFLLGPPIMPVCTLFAPLIATRNLQNQLENVYFLFMAPFRKLHLASSALAPKWNFHFFASHLPSFCAKMVAALGTSKAKAHATHVSVAQHISKSTPFRYYSSQCKPSRFRPHAIAGFRLHAFFRRSETVCRA